MSELYTQLYERYADGSSEKELLSAISGFGVDEECNAVVVEIVGLDAEKRELFGKLFVEIDKQHLVGATTQYSNVLGETKNGDKIAKGCYMKSVSKGSRVYKVGVTTYRTAATVKNTKWVETFNKTIFTNLTRTRCFCDDGDSGGLVYTQHKGEYVPAGIIKGTSKDGKFSYYIKATEIVSALDAYPY